MKFYIDKIILISWGDYYTAGYRALDSFLLFFPGYIRILMIKINQVYLLIYMNIFILCLGLISERILRNVISFIENILVF